MILACFHGGGAVSFTVHLRRELHRRKRRQVACNHDAARERIAHLDLQRKHQPPLALAIFVLPADGKIRPVKRRLFNHGQLAARVPEIGHPQKILLHIVLLFRVKIHAGQLHLFQIAQRAQDERVVALLHGHTLHGDRGCVDPLALNGRKQRLRPGSGSNGDALRSNLRRVRLFDHAAVCNLHRIAHADIRQCARLAVHIQHCGARRQTHADTVGRGELCAALGRFDQ